MSVEAYILAVETGGTKIQLFLGDRGGAIYSRQRVPVRREAGFRGILDAVTAAFPEAVSSARRLGGRIDRIGFGFGGPVDADSGNVLGSMQIGGWEDFPFRQYFEERTGLPVFVYNDTNAAAWGEYLRGAGRGTRQFFYTNMGSGVGGGLVLGGKLYNGQGRGAAEFGQTYVPDLWNPGNRCGARLETLCSGWAIEARLRTGRIPRDSLLWQLCGGEQAKLTCRMLGEAAGRGDPYALRELDRTAEAFSIGLANILCLLCPERIAIGGGVSLIGRPLIEALVRYTSERAFKNLRSPWRVAASELGEDAVPVGVLLLAGEEKLPDRRDG